MKLKMDGKSTSNIEVVNINSFGFWIFIHNKEYYLSFNNYPWFKEARIKEIIHVKLLNDSHIYWPELDIDLDISILEKPEEYPLIYK